MIDLDQAIKIMEAWLVAHPANSLDGPLELRILQDQTLEEDLGWVFFYYTVDESIALAGNAPMIVDRRDGSIHPTGTAYPTSYFIKEYRGQHPM